MQIVLKRTRAWCDIFRSYKVFLNGIHIGKIKQGQTCRFDCTPKSHTLQLKIDWCSSALVTFHVEPHIEMIEFECHGNVNPFLETLARLKPSNEWIVLRMISSSIHESFRS
jgi:hypothetical protein